MGAKIGRDHAADAAAAVTALEPVVVPTRLLATRIWELRGNLTAYDAAYVATAGQYRWAGRVRQSKRQSSMIRASTAPSRSSGLPYRTVWPSSVPMANSGKCRKMPSRPCPSAMS